MTTDEKLDILKRAIEDGAQIHFTFFNTREKRSKKEAYDLSSLYGDEFEQVEYEGESHKVVRLETAFENKILGTIFYD